MCVVAEDGHKSCLVLPLSHNLKLIKPEHIINDYSGRILLSMQSLFIVFTGLSMLLQQCTNRVVLGLCLLLMTQLLRELLIKIWFINCRKDAEDAVVFTYYTL